MDAHSDGPPRAERQNLLPRRAGEKYEAKQKGMTRRGMLAAVSYMICAVTLVMFNKAALSSFNFPCANVITLLQMLSSTALLAVLRLTDTLTFADGSAADVALARSSSGSSISGSSRGGAAVGLGRVVAGMFAPSYSVATGSSGGKGGKGGKSSSRSSGFVPLHTLVRVLPLSLSYLLYMVVGMASIRGVNVPMYTALRRTTVAFTLLAERFLAGRRHSSYTLVSSVWLS
ncbi:hypothetical protein CLOM_g13682 [Closterium sp. NIES-68]|nr:hypothetical protein CLOM_g13682 [Closterium sp. NIES-68]GJP59799.1 hypothetical protein CLOP_g15256 [Closterium sp. NIES-67]